MTFAWYGHLKERENPIFKAILSSWLIALFEYSFLIPAIRLGINQFSIIQLRVIQESIALIVFCIFSITYYKFKFKLNHFIGLIFILLAVFFVFWNSKRF
jgi:uncharacterized protein (DUF486 family)